MLHVEDLEESHCDECGEVAREMVLEGRCHPGAGVVAKYIRGEGVIDLHCRDCGEHVCYVAVAGRPS